METPFFSVLMLTYNSSWDKTRQTLYSVLIQKFKDYEIVIADDGSQENNFSKIEKYFAANNFANYTLVANETNQGIVRNFHSGLVLCKGKYIKPISPGDFLYDENTLSICCKKMKDDSASVYFGRAFFYSYENDMLKLYPDKSNPHDLTPYIRDNSNLIKRNYLQHRDYILGAATFYKTTIFRKYFEEISSVVKFAEDCTMIYMVANNEKFILLDLPNNNPLIWYEYTIGISTNQSSKWQKLLMEDNKNTFRFLNEKNLIPQWMYNYHFGNSKMYRRIVGLIHEPTRLIRKLAKAEKDNVVANNTQGLMKILEA